MTSKFERTLIKYFLLVCGLSGLVCFNINYREKRVQRSLLRTLYSSLYFLFFATTFFSAYHQSYQGFLDVLNDDKTSNLSSNIEIYVFYVMTGLFVFFLVKNFESSKKLFTELLKASTIESFGCELSKQLIGVIAIGEGSLVSLYFINLFWFSWKGWNKLVTIDFWENMTINCHVVTVPVTLVVRASISITLVIDFIQKLVVLLNHRIKKSLTLAESPENFKILEEELEQISQLYFAISSTIKLLEKSFGSIIAILQCAALIIGVNQVEPRFPDVK